MLWGRPKGVLGLKPLRISRNARFSGRSGTDLSRGRGRITKEVIPERAYVPTSPSKRKMAGGAWMCEIEKEIKNEPGSSLIEPPDFAGVHHDKKKIE